MEVFKELGPQLHILLWKLNNGLWSTGVLKLSLLPLLGAVCTRADAVCAGSERACRRRLPGRCVLQFWFGGTDIFFK